MEFASTTLAYIGQQEMLIIAGVALLLFGGAKLPELAKGLGQGIREFKNSMNDEPTPTAKSGANTAEEPTAKTTTEAH